jgi:hypothetical protein
MIQSTVFAFFSDRLGCLGSLAVSVVGTVLLTLLMRLQGNKLFVVC